MSETIKQNLHTHTYYDHGKDGVDDLCQEALRRGFTILGFSGHGFNRPLSRTSMTRESTREYLKAVQEAKEKYKNSLEIYCGVEQDSMNRIDTSEFDYVIGSVHYLEKDGLCWETDYSPEMFAKMLKEGFGGDIQGMIEYYYSKIEEMMDWPEVDIIGHIDLISKFNEHEEFFKFDAPWYLAAAKKCIDKGIRNGLVFEMNTGAIARKNRETPYPHPLLLKYMADNNAKLCVNTDCHDKNYLDLQIQECIDKAKDAGFEYLYKMSPKGLFKAPIDEFYGYAKPYQARALPVTGRIGLHPALK